MITIWVGIYSMLDDVSTVTIDDVVYERFACSFVATVDNHHVVTRAYVAVTKRYCVATPFTVTDSEKVYF